jgi:hypothetical protein
MKRTTGMNWKNKKMKKSIEANTKSNEKTNVKMNMNLNMNMNGEIADAKSFTLFQCSQWNQVTIARL